MFLLLLQLIFYISLKDSELENKIELEKSSPGNIFTFLQCREVKELAHALLHMSRVQSFISNGEKFLF